MQLAVMLQRCGGVPSDRCSCHGDGNELRRSAFKPAPRFAPPVVHDVLALPGERLGAKVRLAMQSRLGADFAQVKVHTGPRAHDAAASVSAQAFTVGRDIVFGRGQYAPDTAAGTSVLTHELVHVMQQRGGHRQPTLVVESADSQAEREAEALADTARGVSGPRAQEVAPAAHLVQRQTGGWAETEAADLDLPMDLALEVQDGGSPVGGTDPVGELSDVQQDEGFFLEAADEDITEPAIYLARRPVAGTPPAAKKHGGGAKSSAKRPAAGSKPTAKKPAVKEKQAVKEVPRITAIDVDLESQKMKLTWSAGRAPEAVTVSTGMGCPNTKDDPCPTGSEWYCTPKGDFEVGSKGDAKTKNPEGAHMSWYVEFIPARGIGIHDSQPANGTPLSHGCVRVGIGDQADALAKEINLNVAKRTKVHVHGKAHTKPWPASGKLLESFKHCAPPQPKRKPPKSKP